MMSLLLIFLTKYEYQYAKMVDYHGIDYFEQESYMLEICQEMQQKSYGLKSWKKQATKGKKNVNNVPTKEGFPLEKKQEQ